MRIKGVSANIIVWNLPDDLTASDLAALFDEFGLVLGASVQHRGREVGRPPQGWVDLAPAKSVDRAIDALDGCIVRDHKLKVRRAPDVSVAEAQRPRKARFRAY